MSRKEIVKIFAPGVVSLISFSIRVALDYVVPTIRVAGRSVRLKLNTLIFGTLLTADLLPFTSILYRHLPLVCFDLLESIMRTVSQDMVTD